MKYLLINSVAGVGSTGKIAADICRKLMREGNEAVLAYGRDKANCDDIKTIKIGNRFDVYWHVGMTRLFDKHGLCSKHATKQFLRWVDNYKPDVIWLHNIHGYYINYEELFRYIKRNNIKFKWTLHDCWSFTGHCSHFTYAKCEQWKSQCSHCSQMQTYPACLFKLNAKKYFGRKKSAFSNVKDLELIVPSLWLKNLVSQSFLKEYPCTVVYNEIDRSVFKSTPSTFRQDFHLEDKKIILGVASVWGNKKGLDDFYKLVTMLNDDYVVVLVGLNDRQIAELPRRIGGIKRINTLGNLSATYSSATVFVNPSKEEAVGMAAKESGDCGITVVAKKNMAAEDTVAKLGSGVVVEQNVFALYKAITGYDYSIGEGGCEIIVFKKTNNQFQLAQLYSVADYFVNPTLEDNFPTVNLEAKACKTYVITYDTGGCAETLL